MKIFRRSTLAGTAIALSLSPALPAFAGAEDIVGGIIGGVIAGGIMSQSKKRTYVAPRSTVSSAQREQNRQVQTALNYFGFPAGTADGVMGSRSRNAVSNYQMYIGYPATGRLADFERDFLLQSHARARAGGFATQSQIASFQDGPRGLLRSYRQQQINAASMQPAYPAPTPVAPSVPAVAAPAQTTVVVNTAPATVPQVAPPAAAASAPATTMAAAAAPAATGLAALNVPNFMADQAEASVTSYCNMVSLRTSTAGGYVTTATLQDPQVALDEQFCLARTFAIARGEELMAKVKAITPAQIQAQCAQFGPLMKDHVAALSFKSPEQVMQDVGQFVLASGIAPTQLKGTAEVCLSVGYRTDDLAVTLGSALLLTVLGEQPYAEVMGHHLVQGFGASKRADLALAWYEIGIDALQSGATPVFAATVPQRNDLMLNAVASYAERNGQNSHLMDAASPAPQAAPAPAMPTFAIAQ